MENYKADSGAGKAGLNLLGAKLFLKKMPGDEKFSRVHAILLTKDGRVLLRYKNGEPRVTGGRFEEGEDMVEALKREVREEINCVIDKCDYLGYIEVEKREYYDSIGVEVEDKDGKEAWARMVARISEILPAEADPDREGNWVYGRTLAPREVATEELGKVEIFGQNNVKLLNEAYKVAREQEYFTELPSTEYEVLNVEVHAE